MKRKETIFKLFKEDIFFFLHRWLNPFFKRIQPKEEELSVEEKTAHYQAEIGALGMHRGMHCLALNHSRILKSEEKNKISLVCIPLSDQVGQDWWWL